MTTPLNAMTTVIPIEDIKQWRGQDVLDPRDEKLGKLEEVFYDTETDTPAFAAVKSGVFGKHLTLVTLAGATAGAAYLRVSVDKGEFKGAPSFDPDAELTIDDEAAAYHYFGLDYRPVGQDARRLAKH
ncbi:MAG: PRC-barrel domain-containing protein [Solirubrobacteraceae bacterium]